MRRLQIFHPDRTGRVSEWPEYRSWEQMKVRCLNKNNPAYKHYGGRGINLCAEWAESFERFFIDVGIKPTPEHSLDRIDNNLGYFKGNVEWATPKQQANNTRRNRRLEYKGKYQTISEWARDIGVTHGAIINRLNGGWSVKDALSKPFKKSTKKRGRILVCLHGQIIPIQQAASLLEVSVGCLYSRIIKGLSTNKEGVFICN